MTDCPIPRRSPHDYSVEVVDPRRLSAADVAGWNALRTGHPLWANPLFGPAFAKAVAAVRDDARVAVWKMDGRVEAVLAHHRRPGGLGRPIAAPFCDYHGLVAAPGFGLSGGEVLASAGLSAFRHAGLVDPARTFPGLDEAHNAWAIELGLDGADGYLETLRQASPKRFKNWRRLRHRLEEMGPLTLRASTDANDFETLLTWKRDQFVRTGVQDVLRPQWAARLMHALFELREGPMTGLMLTLHAGDTLVAGHFGVREGDVYHPWIASNNPDLAQLSPGQAFLDQAIRAMPDLALRVYDLGPGHDHYKRPFALAQRELAGGLSLASGRRRPAGDAAWALAGGSASVAKVRRRLDHIAASDPSLSGRMRGVVEAALALRSRGLNAEPAE